jgi:hypothetical protein
MIFVFVIDTSASMNQVAANGLSLLDHAKSTVEYFMKQRQREPSSRNDRYFLVTCDERDAVRVGWKDHPQQFLREVKKLVATDLSSVARALKHAFALMNQYRLQSGIDRYGQGRYPFLFDPAVCILVTDGHDFTSADQVEDNLDFPRDRARGAELTVEPFRWDQRLFTLSLCMPGRAMVSCASATTACAYLFPLPCVEGFVRPGRFQPKCKPQLQTLSELTGGLCTVSTSMKNMCSNIDAIVKKAQLIGVVMVFEKSLSSATTSTGGNGVRALACTCDSRQHPHQDRYWPIPESYTVDRNLMKLPPRSAQPTLVYQSNAGSLIHVRICFR